MWAKRKGNKEKKKKVKRTRFPTSREEKSLILNFEFGVPFGFQGCPKFNIPLFCEYFFLHARAIPVPLRIETLFSRLLYMRNWCTWKKGKTGENDVFFLPFSVCETIRPWMERVEEKVAETKCDFPFFLRETYIKSPAAHTKKAGNGKKESGKKNMGKTLSSFLLCRSRKRRHHLVLSSFLPLSLHPGSSQVSHLIKNPRTYLSFSPLETWYGFTRFHI